ncbi:MAG: SIS domain-containing protein [Actinobacteria bacterium]|nr:MAG: SIS domain-containing protein [Actinomycetota bacterium]
MRSLGNFPDPFLAEITGQPGAVLRAAEGLAGQVDALGRLAAGGRAARTVVLTAMGGSFHACHPALDRLAANGIPALHVEASELLHFRLPILRGDVLVVAISQSGESAEVVGLAEQIRRLDDRPVLATVTNGTANPLAERSDVALDTRAGQERGPSTMTFAAALVTLSAVAEVLCGAEPPEAVRRTAEAACHVAGRMETMIDDLVADAEGLVGWLDGRPMLVVLGRGPGRAASEMGALVLKEAAGVPADGLETGQFRHGPLELAGPDMAAIVLTEPNTSRQDLRLAEELVDAGAAVMAVSADGGAPVGARAVATGSLDPSFRPAASLVPIQLLAWRLAAERGRTPEMLSRATKVTTRE